MDEEGFVTVRRKGRSGIPRSSSKVSKEKQTPQISYTTHIPSGSTRGHSTSEQNLEKVLAVIETRKRQLVDESGYGGKVKDKLFLNSWTDQIAAVQSLFSGKQADTASTPSDSRPHPARIVCLGIGIVHESRESQFQFLLLDMMQHALQIPAEEVWVYDPLFTSVEIGLLKHRGYQLIPKNERGRHKLDSAYNTLVYMPHCPGKLYDAFIRENWDEQILGGIWASTTSKVEPREQDTTTEPFTSKVVLLANDFRGYIENLPRRRVEEELPSLCQLTSYLSTLPFPRLAPSHIASNAFNSLVFQYIGFEGSKKVDWSTKPPEGSSKGSAAQTEVIEAEIKEEERGKEESKEGHKSANGT